MRKKDRLVVFPRKTSAYNCCQFQPLRCLTAESASPEPRNSCLSISTPATPTRPLDLFPSLRVRRRERYRVSPSARNLFNLRWRSLEAGAHNVLRIMWRRLGNCGRSRSTRDSLWPLGPICKSRTTRGTSNSSTSIPDSARGPIRRDRIYRFHMRRISHAQNFTCNVHTAWLHSPRLVLNRPGVKPKQI